MVITLITLDSLGQEEAVINLKHTSDGTKGIYIGRLARSRRWVAPNSCSEVTDLLELLPGFEQSTAERYNI